MAFSPQRTFGAADCAFYLHSVDELKNPEQAFTITAADFARVNPNTGTAPIFRTRRDRTLTTAVYERVPVLVDKSGDAPVAAWPVKYATMFHMTNDSHLFRTRAELEGQEGAWPIGGNRWQSAAGEWVPLYVGRMFWHFDHRASSVTTNDENLHNAALSEEATAADKSDPDFSVRPQYWVKWADVAPKLPWALAFRDITNPTNERTIVSSILPGAAYNNKAPLVLIDVAPDAALLCGNLCAVALDYVARKKLQGTNANWFIVEQLPVIPPAAYTRAFGPKTAADIVREAVLELTYNAHDMAPFARDMGYVDDAGAVLPPFIWDEERRLHLRAKLDALYFILYGIFDAADPAQSRDDMAYIYSTFPIVERQDVAAYGSYRSRDLALAYINALIAGQPDAVVAG